MRNQTYKKEIRVGMCSWSESRGKRVKRCRGSGKDSKEEFFYMRKELYRQRIWDLYVVIGFDLKREREFVCPENVRKREKEKERVKGICNVCGKIWRQ